MEFDKTDFQDALIARKGEHLGFRQTLSFDRAAQTLPNVMPVG
jgi:predicted nucleic-acid-binding protein